MTLRKNSKNNNKNITFIFSNILLDNVPFCHKTLSVKLHYSMNSFSTDPTPVDNFTVQWSKSLEIQKSLTQDTFGQYISCLIDVFVYTHTVQGSGKEEIAIGKLDLSQLVKLNPKNFKLPLTSKILESNLYFDIEIKGNIIFPEPINPINNNLINKFPNIIVSNKKSWFNFPQTLDRIEIEANKLVEASQILN